MSTPLLEQISFELKSLQGSMLEASARFQDRISELAPVNINSARNLIHYLVLRNTAAQDLQYQLHELGLSSLASCESHTLRQIQVTLERLGVEINSPCPCTMTFGAQKIEDGRERLFGPKAADWSNSVMVTFDKSFLDQPEWILRLMQNGMTVARINCAHDDEKTWIQLVQAIRKVSKESGLSCAIHVDLAGPKLRTLLLKKGKSAGRVKLEPGQSLWLSDSGAGFSGKDVVISPQEEGVIGSLKVGERVYMDDGLILCRVEKMTDRGAKLLVERVSTKKFQLKNEKGMNFPDSSLAIPSLTEYDESCLSFVANYADTVGFSFVRMPSDIELLRDKLSKRTDREIPIILKIETREAVEHLPDLLLEGMRSPDFGVMIARGDLAVEVGFERLVEIQEEISWLCEAAHVPVIWATQVLESLHKSGVATRAEITDAGRAALAECIMINKGPHTLEVLRSLREIAHKSRAQKIKNRLIFRPLKIAERFFEVNK
ncbi:pyruvate kinase [Algoriphagus sanaruensis]|uniref:Pyruvate kinase n=1 Tax=Algoriphagus sanaruensis TaxID=1727163 RepID=A0A142EN19_9BACT|nr:pyruvate kinase [Algoriphagus sanaruensis]AMQ56524.1 pyruvate kinase [Algoriphagus sanaruensis]